MEFKLSKNEMNDLLKQWILFRDEELSTLTNEDKKHRLRFDEFEEKLIKSLPYKNREYAKIVLAKMYDDFIDFCSYYNEKYYKAGFGDCLSLVIMTLGGNCK